MSASDFRHLTLIPASVILRDPKIVPDGEGIYYALFEGGLDMLRMTSYFEYAHRDPLTHGRAAHLYTGATRHMRSRTLCHLLGGADQSSLRKTLVATEMARQAISKTNTPDCKVRDRQSLNHWLANNVNFAFVACEDAEVEGRKLLRRLISPLNIRYPKTPAYAAQLAYWRSRYYPRSGIF